MDSAYVSAQKLAQAQAEGREIIGPALPGPQIEGRFMAADFQINVEERTAVCPAGKINTQCSRLLEEATGKVSYRFEFSTQCHDCALSAQCLGRGGATAPWLLASTIPYCKLGGRSNKPMVSSNA